MYDKFSEHCQQVISYSAAAAAVALRHCAALIYAAAVQYTP